MLPCAATAETPLAPAVAMTCWLNRNYVVAPGRELLAGLAKYMAATHPGEAVYYLDAGFPFSERFPMLPHLSHRTGKQVDLAFRYRAAGSAAPLRPPSPAGYWLYDQPRAGEAEPCRDAASWLRWDFLGLQSHFAGIEIDPASTGDMIRFLAASPLVRRILLEPHLQERLRVAGPKVAFAGCAVARHDDHVHVDLQ